LERNAANTTSHTMPRKAGKFAIQDWARNQEMSCTKSMGDMSGRGLNSGGSKCWAIEGIAADSRSPWAGHVKSSTNVQFVLEWINWEVGTLGVWVGVYQARHMQLWMLQQSTIRLARFIVELLLLAGLVWSKKKVLKKKWPLIRTLVSDSGRKLYRCMLGPVSWHERWGIIFLLCWHSSRVGLTQLLL